MTLEGVDFLISSYGNLNQHALRRGYRSGLEHIIAQQLEGQSVPIIYEKFQIKYVQPSKVRTYTPDFVLPNGIIVETKGRFTPADRQKHLLVRSSS